MTSALMSQYKNVRFPNITSVLQKKCLYASQERSQLYCTALFKQKKKKEREKRNCERFSKMLQILPANFAIKCIKFYHGSVYMMFYYLKKKKKA